MSDKILCEGPEYSRITTILNGNGLNVIAASLLAEEAMRHDSPAVVSKCGGSEADARNTLQLLSLTALPGDSLSIKSTDEEAVRRLYLLSSILFGEQEGYSVSIEGLGVDGRFNGLKDEDRKSKETLRQSLVGLTHGFYRLIYKDGTNNTLKVGDDVLRDIGMVHLMQILGSDRVVTVKGNNPRNLKGLYDLVEGYRA